MKSVEIQKKYKTSVLAKITNVENVHGCHWQESNVQNKFNP